MKQAVLFLYVNGPSAVTVNPAAGNALAYAIDYADTAITPNGILATRGYDAGQARQALAAAQKGPGGGGSGHGDGGHAALAGQRPGGPTTARRADVHGGASAAAEVAADHAALAAQAGTELLSATSLQFTPKSAIPAPLSTTTVALAWAFAELGKPYVWGGHRPELVRLLRA